VSVWCVVTQDGKVYACGEATNGRLGLAPLSASASLLWAREVSQYLDNSPCSVCGV